MPRLPFGLRALLVAASAPRVAEGYGGVGLLRASPALGSIGLDPLRDELRASWISIISRRSGPVFAKRWGVIGGTTTVCPARPSDSPPSIRGTAVSARISRISW
jgi:hypothetical protein